MKLGISSYAYGWAVGVPGRMPAAPLTAFDLLERAEGLGVGVLQIADNLPLDRLAGGEREDLHRRAEEVGIEIEVGTRGITPDHLRRYLDLASSFESDVLRVVIDTALHEPSEDEVVQVLRSVMPAFEAAGVVLAVENHDRFPARTLVRLMERVGSPALGICLDTANSLGAGEGIRAVAQTLAPWTVNLHIKDFHIERLSHLMGFRVEGRPAGEGDLDIPWLLDLIRTQAPRPVTAVLELWPPPEDELDATFAKEADWVARSVRYLRRLV